MPLIHCKVELSLKWVENCVLTTATNANKATFKITDVKLHVQFLLYKQKTMQNYQNY